VAIVVFDRRLEELVAPDAVPEQIGGGFRFTEGPLWNRREAALIFSDLRADAIYRWTEPDGAQIIRQPSGEANGNTYDREGRLVSCEHANRRLSRTAADGAVETLVSHYEGRRLNSPNDVICARNGDLVFTDPPYGLLQPDGSVRGQELPFHGLFRYAVADGSLRLLADDFERPNGLALSEDESLLYVADTQRGEVRAFDVAADGGLGGGRQFAVLRLGATAGRPDGMKLDALGNLYVAGGTPDGVWVFGPEGTLLGLIGVAEGPANLAWGGTEGRTLFLTARTSLFRLAMRVQGQAVTAP